VPTRPYGKLSVDKTFGSGEGRMDSGARRKVELGFVAFLRNFEFCY
jgi:hypothetical protein